MADFLMPSLGADMEEGTVLEWLVKPGDQVHRGDIVAVVDTAKAAVEVEVFVDGIVESLLVDVGAKVPVGTPLARIGPSVPGSTPPTPAETPPVPAETPSVPVESPSMPVESPPVSPKPTPRGHPPAIAPLVRRLADDLGVDLATVSGTGLHGKITRDDVHRAAETPPMPAETPAMPAETPLVRATPSARRVAADLGVDLTVVGERLRTGVLTPSRQDGVIAADDVRRAAETPPVPAETPSVPATKSPQEARSGARPQTEMRTAIARLMARSKREIPHYYLTTTVDLSRARTWLTERNRALPVSERLVMAAPMLKATALAARKHPELNGFWVDDAFVPGTGVHLGVAVSLRGGGLVAPALHDADTLSVEELMARMRDLVTRARAGRLRGSEMTDPTLTVTNLGDQGVESVVGVIYPPQVALVGIGRVVERPWAVDGMLGVHPVTTLTLAADHRATDGFSGSRFLATIDDLLQRPEEL